MSDPTAPVEGTPTSTPAEAAPSGFDMSPVLSRVDELANSIDTRFAAVEQRLPQPEQAQEPDPWAALFGETEQEPDPYQQPQQPTLDVNALRQAHQQDLQKAIEPFQEQMQQLNAERAAERLGQMIPALANTPENAENRQKAFQLVTTALQNYPTAMANQLAADPNFIAAQWKAAEADRLAAGQAPASETVPTLESAGGATPGGASPSPLDQAFAGMPQRKALPDGFYG